VTHCVRTSGSMKASRAYKVGIAGDGCIDWNVRSTVSWYKKPDLGSSSNTRCIKSAEDGWVEAKSRMAAHLLTVVVSSGWVERKLPSFLQ